MPCRVCNRDSGDSDVCQRHEGIQWGPLRFEHEGYWGYSVQANSAGGSDYYGYVDSDGGKFDPANDCDPLSFTEVECLYLWMRDRQIQAAARKQQEKEEVK